MSLIQEVCWWMTIHECIKKLKQHKWKFMYIYKLQIFKITYIYFWLSLANNKYPCKQCWLWKQNISKYLAQFLFSLHINEEEPTRKDEWKPDLFLTDTVRKSDLDNTRRNWSSWAKRSEKHLLTGGLCADILPST